MSTATDGRRRPNLWSYISFGSNPRRRSVSLPVRSPGPAFGKDQRDSERWDTRTSSPLEFLHSFWMDRSSRGKFLKYGGVFAALIFLFFWLSPAERERVRDVVGGHGGSAPASNGKTTCSKPYSSDKPLIQYALVIDAGSTGSRIHVYRFNNCGPAPELEHEDFVETEKRPEGAGLSSYAGDPDGAAKSLDPLMKRAVEAVPDEYKSCSPVVLKATAGLRMLGADKSQELLDAVRQRLETVYPFPVVSKEKDGVVIMDGSLEGVYAWVTTNYLLGKIGGPDKTPTAAVFDLGGRSTQIVFQPTFPSRSGGMPEKLAEGDHKYAMSFGGREFELYQHSHLGFGLNAARDAIFESVLKAKRSSHPTDNSWLSAPIENPCIPPNMTTKERKVKLDGEEYPVRFTGPAVAAPSQCRGLAEKILMKDAKCELAPCSFGGVHQPSLEKTFAKEDVYIFSYFYDRLNPLGMPESFTLREMRDITAKVCQGREAWGSFETVVGAVEELEERAEHCLDLSFMMALLHTGYEMPLDREVRTAKKIKNMELGWALGASLPLLSQESGWKCKIKQIA